MAWTSIGHALVKTGEVKKAVEAHERALRLCQDLGHRRKEGSAWNNLGDTLSGAGRVREAITAYDAALEMYREFQDRHGAGRVLISLARAHESALSPIEARTCYFQAGDAFTQAGSLTEAAQAQASARALAD